MPDEKDKKGKRYFAIIAGLCASGASFFGKLSGDVENFEMLEKNMFSQNIWVLRGVCIALMILCNALVWSFFVKALHSTGGSLAATVSSAATNYFVSFLIGVFIFNERVTILSLMGATLILTGLIFLSKDNAKELKTN